MRNGEEYEPEAVRLATTGAGTEEEADEVKERSEEAAGDAEEDREKEELPPLSDAVAGGRITMLPRLALPSSSSCAPPSDVPSKLPTALAWLLVVRGDGEGVLDGMAMCNRCCVTLPCAGNDMLPP